uniref:Uncharacterized protein n=1 Tax=Trichobilharzia regenti TaxID=157069 RepID=A0AA85J4G3_TRIRE|nr:unnamed protein product [Trichobilharzia regenti]
MFRLLCLLLISVISCTIVEGERIIIVIPPPIQIAVRNTEKDEEKPTTSDKDQPTKTNASNATESTKVEQTPAPPKKEPELIMKDGILYAHDPLSESVSENEYDSSYFRRNGAQRIHGGFIYYATILTFTFKCLVHL